MKAFFAGRRCAGDEITGGVNQVYLFRLLMDNMQCLLHTAPVAMEDDIDLTEAFLAVCRNEQNMNTMLQTMQAVLMEQGSDTV